MRPSFGGGNAMGCGGGDMLRTVHRIFRMAGGGGPSPEPFSSSSDSTTIANANSRKAKDQSAAPNKALTLSSSSSSSFSSSGGPNNNNYNGPPSFSTLINHPKYGAPGAAATAWGSCSDGDMMEWECVDVNNEGGKAVVLYDDFMFGTVPSRDEVNYAISTLQQVFESSFHARTTEAATCKDVESEDNSRREGSEKTNSSSESEVHWIEPSLNIRDSRMLRPDGLDRVHDAFHLLQNESSVQRMVIALSSDKAVWDAVLNNEVVKELRGGSISQDKASDDDADNPVKGILSWVFVNTKAKIMQLIDKIMELTNGLFPLLGNEEKKLQEKLKTSLFLSIIVLLIVVVTRAKSA